MIVDDGKYYLYRHIRLDKNTPFYIGIGTKQGEGLLNRVYSRMYDSLTKNNIWKKIASKTEYRCEVILESDDDDFIQEKEKEFIKLYGRLCENNGGILANIESGGRRNNNNPLISKSIYCCTNNIWYKSIHEASYDLGLDRSTISRVLSGEVTNTKGFIFRFDVKDCGEFYQEDEGWYPLVEGNDNYLINIDRQIKRVDFTVNLDGSRFKVKENYIKPVVRKKGTVQMTISHNNKRFNISLKKRYKEIFKKDWDNV